MIHFNCSACGKDLKVKDDLGGKKGACPHCRQSITVPAMVAPHVGAERQRRG